MLEEVLEKNILEGGLEKEKVVLELEKIDKAKDILKGRYPSYGVISDFIAHLASTEKVFVLAGINKFGGNEIMKLFIKSETRVMAGETGIDEDVFDHIEEEFSKTCKTVGDIINVADKLIGKYPAAKALIEYIDDYLIMLLKTSEESEEEVLDIDKKREKAIHEMIVKIAENDNAEIEELEKVYEEFKEELGKIE